MTEEDGVGTTGHVFARKETGLTVAELRIFMTAVNTAGLPDTAELRVRTMWKVNKYGSKINKIIAVTPE